MKKFWRIFILAAALSAALAPGLSAQGSKSGNVFGDRVQFDKTVHDFGDIQLSDGPVTATFTAKNVGKEALVIYNVVSSCGCTGVEWARQPLRPGEKGTIRATYDNRNGAVPFDKTLTVYFSGIKQPVILRLRGEAHEKPVSLTEAYPAQFGPLGFKQVEIKGGNLQQGEQRGGEVMVANLGKKPLKLSFKDISDGLSLSVSPNPLPANGKGWLTYTVTADRSRWGKNWYYATPVVNGKTYKAVINSDAESRGAAPGAEALRADPNRNLGAGHAQIGIFAITRENFQEWTQEQRAAGSQPMLNGSTVNFPRTKAGKTVTAKFNIRNVGKSELLIYKVDCDSNHLKTLSVPTIAPGGEGTLSVELGTAGFPSGETLVLVTLYTNSPLRPILNLFLSGWIE